MLGTTVPEEWGTLTEEQRGLDSLAGFKRGSRVEGYAVFVCGGCYVCGGGGEEGREETRNVGVGGDE